MGSAQDKLQNYLEDRRGQWVSREELKENLDMHPNHITRVIKSLRKYRIIERRGNSNNRTWVRVR